MRSIYDLIEEDIYKIHEAIPFTLSYKGIELDFELDADNWWIVGDYANEHIVDNMSLWGLENLLEEEFEEVVLDFKVILRDDWYRLKDILLGVYFTSDNYESEYAEYTFKKGTYTLKYINEKLSKN